MSNWLQGNFNEAEPFFTSSLNLALNSKSGIMEFFLKVLYAEFLTMVGRYSEAKSEIKIANIKFGHIQLDRFVSGRATRTLGWIAISDKDYPEAARQFEASIEFFKIDTDDEQVSWSQAGLALTMMGLGNFAQAKQLLTEALWTAIEIKAMIPSYLHCQLQSFT